MKGYNVISDNQKMSLGTSKSNATENIYTQTDKSESLSELFNGIGKLLSGINPSGLINALKTPNKNNQKL